MTLITKGSGEHELFRAQKLQSSLRTAGADENIVNRILAHIESEITDGMSTNEIYYHAFELLKRYGKHPMAARYSLKRAVMDLGPSGFPFEKLIAEIFRQKGFKTRTDVVVSGKCASHEIDFLAEKNDSLIMGEAKFHNTSGFKTDIKVILYIDSRFRDIEKNQFAGYCKDNKLCQFWLVTNTKFTNNAISYALCSAGIKLIGWDFPKTHNLREMIEEVGLHPLTCLTTLTTGEKRKLFDLGHVLCRSVRNNEKLLRQIGISGRKAHEVLEESQLLCKI